MPDQVPFSEILSLFESHGWKLKRTYGDHRIFGKPGSDDLPYWVELQGKKVDGYNAETIKKFLEQGE